MRSCHLRARKKEGACCLEPDQIYGFVCSSVVRNCAEASQWEAAVSLLLSSTGIADVSAHCAGLIACRVRGHWEEAEALLEAMQVAPQVRGRRSRPFPSRRGLRIPMPLSEDAEVELEALDGIFPEAVERLAPQRLRLRLSPEPDNEGYRFAEAVLEFELPDEYPAMAQPMVTAKLPEGAIVGGSEEDLLSVVEAALADTVGNVALFTVAEAVRDWLREHCRLPPEAIEPEAAKQQDCDEMDDVDVDSSDLDEELIEALQEVLAGDKDRLRELRRIKNLETAEQRQALRQVLKTLSAEEREALAFARSSCATCAHAHDCWNLLAGDSAKEEPARMVQLAPAQIECPAGHQLGAFSSRPPDYRKFDGYLYTCDVCGRDGEYRYGVYHCTKCFQQGGRQFDACPSCGISARGSKGGRGGKANKASKSKQRKR
eukprot:s4759_g2.t2